MADRCTYKPEDILQIEIVTRALLDDALGRYIHHPDNWVNIRKALQEGMKALREIKPNHKCCPPGYQIEDKGDVCEPEILIRVRAKYGAPHSKGGTSDKRIVRQL